jgi:transmembrane sensor
VVGIVHDDDWALIMRSVAGEATDADRAALRQWLSEDPARENLLRAIEEAWRASARAPDISVDGDALATSVRHTIRRLERTPDQGTPRRTGVVWAVAIATAAAALVVAISIHRSPADLAVREYATVAGERANIILTDGSEVALGPASRLRVRGREVSLDGEALFSVVHDPDHPFAVHAGRTVVTDVGTRFDVRAYATDTRVRVVVADGAVTVQAGRSARVSLHRGDRATADTSGAVQLVGGVNPDDYTEWTKGRLKFADTPLAEVLAEIGRWYALDVRLEDSTGASMRVNATFTDVPVAGVLEGIAAATGLTFTRSGRTVVFAPRLSH